MKPTIPFAPLALVPLIVAGLTVGVASPAAAAEVSATIDGIVYAADDADVAAGATAVDYTGSASAIEIPDTVTIEGITYDVTAIGVGAFQEAALTEVIIGDGVISIGVEAFEFNPIERVVFGDSVTTIGDRAFESNDITELTLPDGVTTIGDGAFASNNLTDLVLPDGVTTIASSAFQANAIRNLVLPDSVTSIGNFAFQVNEIESLTLPHDLTSIGIFAFSLNRLTTVTIPASVTTIGDRAFDNNPLAEVITLGPAPLLGATAFDDFEPIVVSYPWRFDSSQVAEGYTAPTWSGYASRAIATVAFDAAGGGSTPDAQSVPVDSPLTEPPVPAREGFLFDGWFVGSADGALWDFADPVDTDTLTAADTADSTADLVLVAGWTAVPAAEPDPDPAPGDGPVPGDGEPAEPDSGSGSGEGSSGEGELAATGAEQVPSAAGLAAALLLLGALALTISRGRTRSGTA